MHFHARGWATDRRRRGGHFRPPLRALPPRRPQSDARAHRRRPARHRYLRGHRLSPPPLLPRHRRGGGAPVMTGRTIPVADTPKALTPTWLTAALTASRVLDGGRVIDTRFHPIGTGQMCDCVRLNIRYDRPTHAPSTIVAKLPAADETSRATAKSLRSY